MNLKDDFKIYWNNFAIAKLTPGKDYLNPNFELIVDDILEQNQKQKLIYLLKNGLKNKIDTVLKVLLI